MQVTLEIPDTYAAELTAAGKNPARAALEALALEGYRSGRLFEEDIRVLLGYETRMQVHELLKEHGVDLNFSVDDFQRDVRTLDRLFGNSAQSNAA